VDSPIVAVAIGVVFLFGALAAVVAAITEAVGRFLGLRGEYLLRGLRTMLDGGGTFQLTDLGLRKLVRKQTSIQEKDGDQQNASEAWVGRLMGHPLVQDTADKGDLPAAAGDRALKRPDRRRLPSYLSARTFAHALLDLVVPDAAGTTTITAVRDAVEAMSESTLKARLLALLDDSQDDLDRFRRSVEQWYDDQMARVSGWYKRHVRWISFALGLVLVVGVNVGLVAVSRALYTDQVLRDSVVTQAVAASDCTGKSAGDCIGSARQELDKARAAGLPWGWGTVPACVDRTDCSWAERYGLADPDRNGSADVDFLLLVVVGYAAMLVALVPGSRFWFDLLKRLGSLQETGPRPPRADGATG
jgi:hypothetical protein